jgi:hypothetical protein
MGQGMRTLIHTQSAQLYQEERQQAQNRFRLLHPHLEEGVPLT